MGYQSFVIRIGEEANGAYPVTADFQGVTRTASIPADLPLLDDREIAEAQAWLARGFNDPEDAVEFGSRLFQTLFPLDILEMFREAEQRVAPADNLRLVLTVPESLAGLPWELAYDAWGRHGFLARSSTAPLVRRYTDVPFPHQPPRSGPLRVLVVTAQPEDRDRLSPEQETEAIVAALKKGSSLRNRLRTLWRHVVEPRTLPDLVRRLRQGRRFQVDEPLHHATRATLQERIVRAREEDRAYHVIHFVGHAQDGPGGPSLLLERDGRSDPISAQGFAEMVGEGPVNLVVLNACETASASGVFQSMAEATLRRGVPAVIGMQVPILDSAAADFSRELYRLWAAGEPIEAALAHARRLIRQQGWEAASDWSIPVLYLGRTPGLTLQPLERLRRFALPARLAKRTYGAIVAVLGAIMLFLAVPATARTIRTEVWPVRCVWQYPMDENKFTVAFNTFSVVDEEGAPVRSSDGRALADFLYERYAFGFEDLELGIPYQLRPPGHTCIVQGRNRQERADAAAEQAEEINADVIIYGVITQTIGGPRMALEFHVDYRGFQDAEEIAGPYALGGSLPVKLPFVPEDLLVIEHPPHLVRTDVLNLLTIGLSYLSVDNVETAQQFFERAEENEYWPDTDGKEIVYLLLGNANVRRAFLQSSAEAVSAAQSNYARALAIRPDYARAKLGLAEVTYLEAKGEPKSLPCDKIDWTGVTTATAMYDEAQRLGRAQGDETIEPSVHLGLGRIYVLRGYCAKAIPPADAEQELGLAKQELELVIAAYDPADPRASQRAGLAHGLLAVMALGEKDLSTAVRHYESAARLTRPFYRAYYTSRKGDAYCEYGQADLAELAYREAIETARLYGYRERVEEYTSKLAAVQTDGCP